MSLITRCPVCATLFKVVPDQLRISDGWVRCGQCEGVFDASLNLQTAVVAVDTGGDHKSTANSLPVTQPNALPVAQSAALPVTDDAVDILLGSREDLLALGPAVHGPA